MLLKGCIETTKADLFSDCWFRYGEKHRLLNRWTLLVSKVSGGFFSKDYIMHATLFLIGADGVFDLLCIAFEQAVDEDWLRTARCFDGEIGKENT